MNRQGLGIDAGGSSTGWLLVDAKGQVVGRGRTGGITGHLFRAPGKLGEEGMTSLERLRGLLAEARQAGRPTGVVMGAAGLSSGSEAANMLEATVCEALNLPRDAVFVDNDMTIAYRSAFEPGEGVLVYGGTGSIAFHIPRSGPALRVGGYGYLIDDAGGGYWIGQQGLRTVLRWQDELGMPSARPLAREIYLQMGVGDWPGIREHIYSGGRSRVAALAPAVARAAAAGDVAAAEILQQAGGELARLVRSVLGRLGQILPVTLLGGVTNMGPYLLDALREGLPHGTQLSTSPEDPVEAAARLAVRIRSADPGN